MTVWEIGLEVVLVVGNLMLRIIMMTEDLNNKSKQFVLVYFVDSQNCMQWMEAGNLFHARQQRLAAISTFILGYVETEG